MNGTIIYEVIICKKSLLNRYKEKRSLLALFTGSRDPSCFANELRAPTSFIADTQQAPPFESGLITETNEAAIGAPTKDKGRFFVRIIKEGPSKLSLLAHFNDGNFTARSLKCAPELIHKVSVTKWVSAYCRFRKLSSRKMKL